MGGTAPLGTSERNIKMENVVTPLAVVVLLVAGCLMTMRTFWRKRTLGRMPVKTWLDE